MGGVVFTTTAYGQTVDEAFESAVEDAEYHNGKDGRTGTIAEKSSHTVIPASEYESEDKREYAHQLINECDRRVDSKMGPAGAISLDGTDEAERYREARDLQGDDGTLWLFFGWANK